MFRVVFSLARCSEMQKYIVNIPNQIFWGHCVRHISSHKCNRSENMSSNMHHRHAVSCGTVHLLCRSGHLPHIDIHNGGRHVIFTQTRHGSFLSSYRASLMDFYQGYLSPESPPVALTMRYLETIHDVTGLPWWGSIILSTVILRTTVTLPFAIYTSHLMAKNGLLAPEIRNAELKLRMEIDAISSYKRWSKKYTQFKYNQLMKKTVRDLYVRDNCHPMKAGAVVWFQLPVWIFTSVSLRNLCGFTPIDVPVQCSTLLSEGLFWCSNLTIPDTTLILPISAAILNLIIIEVSMLQNMQKGPGNILRKIMVNAWRCLILCMVPIGAVLPSAITLYWVTSSTCGLVQNVVMRSVGVQRALRVPHVPGMSLTPYKDMWEIAKKKYMWRKRSDPKSD